MPIERGTGDLLKADVDALVNAVNTVGVMGRGIALQFKTAFPDNFRAYKSACDSGEVRPGKVHIVRLDSGLVVVNFPTKTDWRKPSKLDYIRDGLVDLVAQVQQLGIRSIAVPALGCGNGGLDWMEVKPLIENSFSGLPDVKVMLFEPT